MEPEEPEMNHRPWYLPLVCSLVLILLHPGAQARDIAGPAPEFPHREPENWLNSPPLTLEELRGKVVLVKFWTFDCWSCLRTFPWVESIEERFGSLGLVVIGVHTPEFEHERNPSRVKAKVQGFGLGYPVMIDNDFAYWNALGAHDWPSFFLIDKKGMLRARYRGETRVGDPQAMRMEHSIEQLVAE